MGSVLGGVAAIVSAVAGLIGILYQPAAPGPGDPTAGQHAALPPPSRAPSENPPSAALHPDVAGVDEDAPLLTRASDEHAQAAGTSARAGDVIARWTDGCFYSANALQSLDDRLYVHFRFGAEHWVDARNVFLQGQASNDWLRAGAKVFVRSQDRSTKWLRSRLVETNQDRYLVVIDDEGCHDGAQRLWVGRDQLAMAPAFEPR